MKTSEIINEIEKFAPIAVSNEFVQKTGGYDNSGLLIGGEEVSHEKMLVCVDVEKKDIDFAIENGIKFIFSHHPYIYGKLADVNVESFKGREIISLLKNDITVYSAHLNLDACAGGIDDNLAWMLGGEIESVCDGLSCGGYGKVSVLKKSVCGCEFEKVLNEKFTLSKCVIAREKVKKIASFCGSGLGEAEFFWGIENGADTFVSSDIRHHMLVEASRFEVNMFDIPHGYSEFVCMKECVKNMNFAGVEIFFQSGKVGEK